MILFNYETEFKLDDESCYKSWIQRIISSESKQLAELNYIFCDDDYLHQLNVQYLDHDTLTDIISFDYSEGVFISGDIFISIPRVLDNTKEFDVSFQDELLRVMSHGILHFCGYNDKTKDEAKFMRLKEQEKINMFHVEH